jgi:hypothetical protein
MRAFKTHIREAAGKNLHLEHIEDAIFNDGMKGGEDAVRFLQSVGEMLQTNSSQSYGITVKWDGAPAVFCGTNPENGKFFVGSKSVFNVNPKINYTNADINKNHGHSKGLADKLKAALKHFKDLNIKGVLQGDILFTKSDIKSASINGEPHLTFTPNTITYAIPKDSDLAKKVKSANIGVVWHTTYKGSTLQKMKASFGANASRLKKTKNVWSIDASFEDDTGVASLTIDEYNELHKRISKADNLLSKWGKDADVIINNTKVQSEIKIYINTLVKQGTTTGSAIGLIKYISDKMQIAADALKSEAGRERRHRDKDNLVQFLKDNTKALDGLFSLHTALTDAKTLLIRKLEKAKSIGTFIQTPKGLKVTAPEGFVAINRIKGNAFKLVDRLEFSRANFTVDKDWIKG